MKKLFYILFLTFSFTGYGQNLVPNPDFELYSICPFTSDDFGVDFWVNPIPGVTPDYYNSCSVGVMGVPSNIAGFQNSLSGSAYAGTVNYIDNMPAWREYMVTALTETLVAGCYHLEIRYSHADEGGISSGLGMYLSAGIPASYIGLTPQMEVVGIISDYDNWLTLSVDFISTGGETHVSIGNFNDNASTDFVIGTGAEPLYGYTYIDFVSVESCLAGCEAEAGNVMITNSPTCPTETISFEVINYNATADYQQYILVVDDANEIVEIVIGSIGDYTYDYCGDFFIYSYNIEIAGTATIPVIGDDILTYDCVSNCCDTEFEVISFVDDELPVFVYVMPHPNVVNGMPFSFYCAEDVPVAEQAEYTDNCIPDGFVDVVEIDDTTPCDGGMITRTWSLMDSCIAFDVGPTHFITVLPAPLSSYIDPPSDIIINCIDAPVSALNLDYSNGLTNSCGLSGTVMPIITDNYDICGGSIEIKWTETDACNRTVEYIQTVTVLATDLPEFLNTPADKMISCDEIPAIGPDLVVSNSLLDGCKIEETVTANIINNYNGCNGNVILEWKYTDICSREVIYKQVLTIEEPSKAIYGDEPAPISVSCTELSSLPILLSYSNNELGNCNISGESIAAQVGVVDECGGEISYVWQFVDGCGRTITYSQLITITPPDFIYFIDIPSDTILSCDIDSYMPPILKYTNELTEDCLNAGDVIGVPSSSGSDLLITWSYTLCNQTINATQLVSLAEDELTILSINCSVDNNFYTVSLSTADQSVITVNIGVVSDEGSGIFTVSDIPISDTLHIEAVELSTNCLDELLVLPPDCSCLPIDPPTSNGDFTICIHELPITLSVSESSGNLASWFDAANGGVLLESNSLVYTVPLGLSPSTYLYYVEHIDSLNSNCTSLVRTAVTLTILNIPDILDIELESCKSYIDGFADFDLTLVNDMIGNTLLYNISFYEIEDDAYIENNPIVDLDFSSNIDDRLIFARVEDSLSCFSVININLHSIPFPEADIMVIDESCKGEDDGSIGIDVVSGIYPILTSINGIDFVDSFTYNDLENGDYMLELIDSFSCVNIVPFAIEEGLEIELSFFNVICSDNGTDDLLEDDFYTITYIVDSTLGDFNYQLFVDNVAQEVQVSGLNYTFVIPADSIIHNFIFEDTDNGCFIESFTSELNPCSMVCTVFPDATIFVNPSNVLDCSVQSIGISSMVEEDVDYHWMFNNTLLTSGDLTIEQEGQIILIAIDTITGCQAQDTLDIIDLETYPLVELTSGDTLSCNVDQAVIYTISSPVGSQFAYKWYKGNELLMVEDNKLSVENGGWYSLVVTDTDLGCSNVDSIFIVEEQWVTLTLPLELNFLPSETNVINAETNIVEIDIDSIYWTPSDGLSCTDCFNPEVLVDENNIYTLTVVDVNGCIASASIRVLSEEVTDIYVPNIFNPSGEEGEAFFIITPSNGINLVDLELSVFDRWGSLLYRKNNLHIANRTDFWDGTYKGIPLSPGVYVYAYRAILENGKTLNGVGDVSIVR